MNYWRWFIKCEQINKLSTELIICSCIVVSLLICRLPSNVDLFQPVRERSHKFVQNRCIYYLLSFINQATNQYENIGMRNMQELFFSWASCTVCVPNVFITFKRTKYRITSLQEKDEKMIYVTSDRYFCGLLSLLFNYFWADWKCCISKRP